MRPLAPGALLLPRESAERRAAAWQAAVEQVIAARAAQRWRALRFGGTIPSVAAGPPVVVPPSALLEQDDETTAPRGGLIQQYADLSVQLNALLELRLERFRNEHCTAGDLGSFSLGCQDNFNPPRVDAQVNVRSGGVVAQRLHLNIDYDTQREFDASNNIQVYYEGLEDEILQRVELGNISFAAPRSRFIAGNIPTNNFGVAVQGQLGALDFGAIYAQQKGNVARARTYVVGDQTVQPVDRLAADRDFEPQRFFFVVNPRSLPGYPAVDVLTVSGAALPDALRPVDVRIYRHRSSINLPTNQANLSGIQAVALRADSPQRQGPINWEVLVEGRDYYLDPSGVWFALVQRVDQDDFLAVSYVNALGDTVGTFPSEARAGVVDTLELIYVPRSAPDVPTFFYEMRQFYRVGGVDDVSRTSVAVDVLVGGSQRPEAASPTFLALLGMALQSDATRFDEFNRLFPRQRDPGLGAPLRDYFLVFPHLAPFADSSRLAAEFRTDSLYRTPTNDVRTRGPTPLFQLNLHYDARGGDGGGTLQLGGFQIREGSERVTAAGRQLARNVDYTVNYEIGQLTFVRPDSLFRQPTQVTVQFEETGAFAVAPTTILGLQTRYDFGEHGTLTALALSQRQRTTFTRPPLGFEPAASLVAGVAGAFRFRPMRLTRWLDALPLVETTRPSTINIDAELATSRPSPNQIGVAYVETFEDEGGTLLSLNENNWELGSRPASPRGITPVEGTGFLDTDASLLTWQNLIPNSSGQVVQLRAQDIDPSIRIIGASQRAEPVLWAALLPDTLGGIVNPETFRQRWLVPHTDGPRWRTMVQPLSATGVDLSRVEYLELWVLEDTARTARNAGLTLAFDFGSVHEDAVAFQPESFTIAGGDTTYSGRRRTGEGRLDTERDTLTGAFNAALDDNGIHGDVADSILNTDNGELVRDMPLCRSALATALEVYSWGSALQRCTRRNGQLDTEDLNNDQHLDSLIAATGEDVLRYVLPLGDPRYEVRNGGTVPGVGIWRLYRIPFRSDTLQIGAPNVRQIRALRITVAAQQLARPESTVFFAVSRMRLVGAPWVKRSGSPIAGLSGDRGEPHGEVIASVISTENVDDLGYESPPGVTDAGQNVGGQVGATQINEKSLRIIGVDVRAGERAEAFFRFPEGDRNFLGYRQLRVWARGRGTGWNGQQVRFFVKVGQDEQNFYLYRTPARSDTWLPEVLVDFDQWSVLRAQIERRFLQGLPPSGAAECGGDTLAYVACSGGYVVHVRHPSIAPPNLTRVQELAVGVVRDSGSALDSIELWVDDIRLGGVVNTPGYAGAVTVGIAAGDVADFTIGASLRDGNFRQLGENPSYVSTSTVAFASTIRLERFGLERLGLAMPLTIRSDRARQDPYFLNQTDVLAEGLGDLRRPLATSTSYSLNLRRTRTGTRWWERIVVDNLIVSANWARGATTSELSSSTSRLSDVRADYRLVPGDLSVRYVPGFLRGILQGLPLFLRRSDLVRGLTDGRLRLTPVSVQLSSGVTRSDATRASFRVPIAVPSDSAAPVVSTTAVLRSTAVVGLRPFASMTMGINTSVNNDLKDYGDATTVARLASFSRRRFLGMDVGLVSQRQLGTRLGWTPPLASWLRPRFSWTSDFSLSRDPNSPEPEREEGDTAGAFRLPTTFANGTVLDMSAAIDVSRFLRGVLGDSFALRRALDRITQLDVGRRLERRSQFNRPGFDPGAGYQLGLMGLGGFRAQDGRAADAASQLQQDRLTFGVRAPLGLTASGTYTERLADVWMLRSTNVQQQVTTEREWPSVQVRWLFSPRAGWIRKALNSVQASAAYQERSGQSRFPSAGTGALQFERHSVGRPLSLSVSWLSGIVTSFNTTDERSLENRAGTLTHSDGSSASAGLVFAFRAPQEFLPLPAAIRTNLQWQSRLFKTCLAGALSAGGCTLIADSRRNEYNLTMDSELGPNATAGLSASYVLNDDRHLNRKFSQFSLTVHARIAFNAGQIR